MDYLGVLLGELSLEIDEEGESKLTDLHLGHCFTGFLRGNQAWSHLWQTIGLY